MEPRRPRSTRRNTRMDTNVGATHASPSPGHGSRATDHGLNQPRNTRNTRKGRTGRPQISPIDAGASRPKGVLDERRTTSHGARRLRATSDEGRTTRPPAADPAALSPCHLSLVPVHYLHSATPRTNDKRVGEPRRVVQMWRVRNECDGRRIWEAERKTGWRGGPRVLWDRTVALITTKA